MTTRQQLKFLLNDQMLELENVPATQTLLDYLRLERTLTGTKEGCAEGDCGACTVLVGRMDNGRVKYESVNSCIRFVASLDGCHIVTIEHLKGKDGELHPIQQAMVTHHGSQCGFCTPGFVMSLYAMWMNEIEPDVALVERYLQGNLCRCTGYAPIVKAALDITANGKLEDDFLIAERESILAQLSQIQDDMIVEISDGNEQFFAPATRDQFATIYAANPEATIVAGSTDVGLWVTKQMRDISPVIFASRLRDFRNIEVSDNSIKVDGGASYSDLLETIDEYLPELSQFWRRIGGEQVRNMGTVGGNMANGSPIGDTPPPLIALGATLTLRKGDERRTIDLEKFFVDYGKQDREKGEFVETIEIPLPAEDQIFAAYKISKRRDEDISAVCAAISATIDDGRIKDIRIAFGGMAATPKRASAVENALIGAPWSERSIMDAKQLFANDYKPLSDWRASADYRLSVAQNLLERFYLEHADENSFSLDDLARAATLEAVL
ncbi:xanthine dehydrogenase small subunit [Maritalea sp.]|uniref:xanthine dehydrogenase small subunit n=1 Tax=Maritalea sp. TaxID=2003361 RepID=UPI003EF27F05